MAANNISVGDADTVMVNNQCNTDTMIVNNVNVMQTQ